MMHDDDGIMSVVMITKKFNVWIGILALRCGIVIATLHDLRRG